MTSTNKTLSLTLLILVSFIPPRLLAGELSAGLFTGRAQFKEKIINEFEVPHRKEANLLLNTDEYEQLINPESTTNCERSCSFTQRLSASLFLATVEVRQMILNILELSNKENTEEVELQPSTYDTDELIDREYIEREINENTDYWSLYFEEDAIHLENRLGAAPFTSSISASARTENRLEPAHQGVITLPVKTNSLGGGMSCLRPPVEPDDAYEDTYEEDEKDELSEEETRELTYLVRYQLTLPPTDPFSIFTKLAQTTNSIILKFKFSDQDYVLKLSPPKMGPQLFDREFAALEQAHRTKSPNVIRMITWVNVKLSGESAFLRALVLPFYPMDLAFYIKYRFSPVSVLRSQEGVNRLKLVHGRLKTDDYYCLMLMAEALKGLLQLHRTGLGSSDVKEENWLFDPNRFKVVISDLAYAAPLETLIKRYSPAALPEGFYRQKSILEYDRRAFGLVMARALSEWFMVWDDNEGNTFRGKYSKELDNGRIPQGYLTDYARHCSTQGSKLDEIIKSPEYSRGLSAQTVSALRLACELMNTESTNGVSLEQVQDKLEHLINQP